MIDMMIMNHDGDEDDDGDDDDYDDADANQYQEEGRNLRVTLLTVITHEG